jgi:hypothetical protein
MTLCPMSVVLRRSRTRNPQSGQAAVETAITLPLTLFVILGTLQLFMMLQARILTEYAVFRAVRSGSVNHGECKRMVHAAIATLLPSITRVNGAEELGKAFGRRRDNRFAPDFDSKHDGSIVWVIRERPLPEEIKAEEDPGFDDPLDAEDPVRLEARLVYWYPMRIPFVNWVMSKMFLAHFAMEDFTGTSPIIPTNTKAKWTAGKTSLAKDLGAEMLERSRKNQFVFPIQAHYAMRMMTPLRRANFKQPRCL